MAEFIVTIEDGIGRDEEGVQLFDLTGKNYTLSKYVEDKVDSLLVTTLMRNGVSAEDVISLHKAGVI